MAIRKVAKAKWACGLCGQIYGVTVEDGHENGPPMSCSCEDEKPFAYTFTEFKENSAACEVFDRLCVLEHLEQATSWEHLRLLVAQYDRHQTDRAFTRQALKFDDVASSGERVLLHAILFAIDFAGLADEMDTPAPGTNYRVWARLNVLSWSWRHAMTCCIARRD